MNVPFPVLPLKRPWVRRLVWLIAAVASLWLLAWALVPIWLKQELQQRGSALLGRQVTVGAVEFRPWSMDLRVHELSVARSGSTAAQLQIRLASLNVSLESLLRLAPVLDGLALEEPRLWLQRQGDGRYDIDDMLQRLANDGGPTPAEPARFALYNIHLNQGAIEFVDAPAGRTHTVRDLKLAIPFLSNLDSQRDVTTAPHLSFILNGAAFDSAAHSLPFARTHKTDVDLHLKDLDLAPYLGYLPAQLPVRLLAGVLDADLKLAFEQTSAPQLKLTGLLQARQMRLGDARAQELLRFEALRLRLDDVRPLTRVVRLSHLEWVKPQLRVQRLKSGQLNLWQAPVGAPAAAPASGASNATPWQFALAELALRDARIDWQDDRVSPAGRSARLSLTELNATAHSVQWPLAAPVGFEGQGTVSREAGTAGATVRFAGQGSDRAAQVRLDVARWPLALVAPYLAGLLEPELNGLVEGSLALDWKAAANADAGTLTLTLPQLRLDQLTLGKGPERAVAVQRLELQNANVDLHRQLLAWDALTITQPSVQIERGADGRWMFEHWWPAPSAPASASPPPWQVAAGELRVSGGRASLLDRSTRRPVRLTVTDWQSQLLGLDTRNAAPATLRSSARVSASSRIDPGSVRFEGKLLVAPLSLQGQLDLKHLPAHALAPYAAALWQADLLRADTSFKGQVRFGSSPQGVSLALKGDTSVEDLRIHARLPDPAAAAYGEELLNWKLLALRGLQVSLAPQQPTRIDVQETVLSDFFARMVVSTEGRLNLQDALRSAPATGTEATPPQPQPAAAATVVNLGPTTLLGGRIDFTDHFVKPNYSANLSELAGRLGAISSMPGPNGDNTAELELRGRAQGTASLDIQGRLNPLAQPVTLDITGKVRDLELPPLSPYAIKYAGHGIERGKLSVDVAYKVLPDGQLTASNQLVLNQLRFGAAVPDAPNSLPVSLAVALLSDRNGVIDINLPVSGSLNDPQFSLGPVIWKVVVNLIGKALTSPFALLSAAVGDNSESLSTVSFSAGSATLSAEGQRALDKVARALLERPALTLSVVGTASLEQERDAFKRHQLASMIDSERRRERLGAAAPQAPASATTDDAQADARLLRTVYRRGDFPKPRNFLGLLKDVPAAEMESLLLASLPADEQSMRDLAVQRGVAVKDYLAARQVPLERLFLGAAKTVAPEAKWSPRAELVLEVR